jgi:hypothetical protein
MRLLLAAAALMLAVPAGAQAPPTWTTTSNGEGFGLILGPRGGPAVLSLACVRGTSAVLAIAYGVKPVPGQQELIIRFDQRRVTFVVKPDAIKAGKMVEASAKAGPVLLDSIRTARSLQADYAGVKLGPFPAPPAAMGQAFARRCGPLI